MKIIALAVLAPLALSLFTGCSSGSDAGDSNGDPSFSCDVAANDSGFGYDARRCATFASMPSDLRDGNCTAGESEQIVASCSTDGLIGTCKVPNTNFESITYSYYSDSTLADAQTSCDGLKGTFEAAQ